MLRGGKTADDEMLSVIVPVYNVEQYLDRCVESLLEQTYQNLEIILVDDGSLDSCSEKCDNWARFDSRVKTIHEENGGLSFARNTGIDFATGDYIGFVDSDDYVEPEMYATLFSALKDSGKKIACCGRVFHDSRGRKKLMYSLSKARVYEKEESIREVLIGNSVDVSACDKLYSIDIFKNIRFPVGRISEDSAVIMQILSESNGLIHVGAPFYHYVSRSDSISKSSYSRQSKDAFYHAIAIERYIEDNYSNLSSQGHIYMHAVSSGLMQAIQITKGNVLKYRDDYEEYKDAMKRTALPYYCSADIGVKSKIKSICALLGVYRYLQSAIDYIKNVQGCQDK